jgi:hypothetical protein
MICLHRVDRLVCRWIRRCRRFWGQWSVSKARSDAEAGVDGAADKLATLSRSLVDLTREKFGTAGTEYTSDRNTVSQAAQMVIAAEKSRIASAQGNNEATVAELKTANAIANEQADQLSEIKATMQEVLQALRPSTAAGGTGSPFIRDYYRQQQL